MIGDTLTRGSPDNQTMHSLPFKAAPTNCNIYSDWLHMTHNPYCINFSAHLQTFLSDGSTVNLNLGCTNDLGKLHRMT